MGKHNAVHAQEKIMSNDKELIDELVKILNTTIRQDIPKRLKCSIPIDILVALATRSETAMRCVMAAKKNPELVEYAELATKSYLDEVEFFCDLVTHITSRKREEVFAQVNSILDELSAFLIEHTKNWDQSWHDIWSRNEIVDSYRH